MKYKGPATDMIRGDLRLIGGEARSEGEFEGEGVEEVFATHGAFNLDSEPSVANPA